LRVGVGSFDPHDHVKEPTVRLARDVDVPAIRYQGNWIPHRLRPAVDGRTFFVGDSAGHCLPTTAEGIRPALYFGLACGRELRAGVGSFDPHDHVKEPTVRLARDVDVPAIRYQGNWIPHRLRPAVDGRTFFVGDSAGHCLPTTAEGIRPALYFGLACGRELRA